jgi:hypothetical protein
MLACKQFADHVVTNDMSMLEDLCLTMENVNRNAVKVHSKMIDLFGTIAQSVDK